MQCPYSWLRNRTYCAISRKVSARLYSQIKDLPPWLPYGKIEAGSIMGDSVSTALNTQLQQQTHVITCDWRLYSLLLNLRLFLPSQALALSRVRWLLFVKSTRLGEVAYWEIKQFFSSPVS